MFELRPVERPYPGLRAFEPHEAEIFFGREAHTDRLLAILQRERFLAVIGPSGSGKSSLVRAGLLPGLAMGSLGTGSDWRVALLRPGDRPMRSLAAALLQPAVLGRHLLPERGGEGALPAAPDDADIAALEAELRRGPLSLARVVAEAQQRHLEAGTAAASPPPAFNLLVLVDQFEEIFTYAEAGGRQAADESEAFVSLLLAARDAVKAQAREPGLHVALTMRTDFLGNCVRFDELPEAINQAQYLTPRLKRDEIDRAIRGPAELWGGRIDDSLVAELINATGQSADQLPLVQHALARMWAEASRRQPDAPLLDWPVANAIGGVAGAIAVHAEELWKAFDSARRYAVIGLFTAITERRLSDRGGQDVRRPQTLGRIAAWLDVPIEELAELVRHYSAPGVCFLQYSATLDASTVIDLSHEALIRQWPDLQSWVADEAARADGLRQWSKRASAYHKGTGSLLTGADLRSAQHWLGRGEPEPPKDRSHRTQADMPLTSNWAQRYADELGAAPTPDGQDASGGEGRTPTADEELARLALEQTRSFVTKSAAAEQRAANAEAERLEREANYQRQLAEAAQTQAQRARRQTVFFALFGVVALLLALFGGWSWQRASENAQAAIAASDKASAATAIAEQKAQEAEASASAATVAKAAALAAAASQAEAANAAEKAKADALAAAAAQGDAAKAAELAKREALAAQSTAEKSQASLKLALIDATQQRMVADANAYYTGRKSASDTTAMRLALAALRVKATPEAWGELQPPATDHDEQKVLEARAKIATVAWSPDGSRIVSGSYDNTLRLWDASSGEPIGQPFKGHTDTVKSVAWSPDGSRIVSGSNDNTLRLWDARSGEPIGKPLKGHTDWVSSVAWSPDGSRIVSGSHDHSLRLWDTRSGEPIGKPRAEHMSTVFSVAWSPDGSRIVSGSRDNTLRLWNARSGEPIGLPLKGHTRVIYSVAWSPDGSRIVSGSEDNTLRLWDARSGEPLASVPQPLKGHTNSVDSVAWSPDGSRIVSGSWDNTLRLWDARSGEPIGQPRKGHTNSVYSVAWSPDGSRIVSGSSDNTLRLWDARSGEPIGQALKGYAGSVTSATWSPDGSRIVSGSNFEALRMWNASSGEPIGKPLEWFADSVDSLAWSPDGSRIVSGSSHHTLRLWDARTGEPIGQPLKGHTNTVESVAWSPDGSRIVSGSMDDTLRLWDARSGKPIGKPRKEHKSTVGSVAWSPDGSRIVSGSWDKTLRLWDARSGEPIGQPLNGHRGSVSSVAWSPDGSRIVSGSGDNTLLLWDARSGEPIGQPLNGHRGSVSSVAWSPDGSRIVSGSHDNTLRLWDARSGEPIGQPLKGHTDSVTSVAWSPDGSRIVSGSRDNTLRLWLSPTVWVDKLCGMLTRNFSPEEWDHYVGPAIPYTVQCPKLPVPKRGEWLVEGAKAGR